MLLRLLEEVAHAAGAHADEHLDEVRAGDGEEGHARLPGNRLGQQCLARARGADQEHALRDAAAEAQKFLGLLEEVDDLEQLFFGFVGAGHVFKGDRGVVAGEHARLALAEGERLVVAALSLAEDEVDEGDDDDGRQEDAQQAQPVPQIARLLIDDAHAPFGVIGGGHAQETQLFHDRSVTAKLYVVGGAVGIAVEDAHFATVSRDL